MNKLGLRSAVLMAGAVLGLGVVGVGTASAAPAAPTAAAATTCSTSHTSSTGSARCTGTTKKYRVKVGCVDPLRGGSVGTVYGPYVSSGQTSSKTCPFEGNVQTLVSSVAVQIQ
jgi:hypothetical protein